MKPDTFEESYQSSIQIIESMKLSENNKKEILKIMSSLKYEHNRSNNYYQLNIETLEEEKKILLNNFIKKDKDANYLYDRIQKYENTYFYKIYKRFSRNDK